MRVNPRKYGPERRGLLAPLGRKYRLDYDIEMIYTGCRPVQIAFQLVGCGADLLAGLRYPDAIPTTNRKVGKSTAKMVARSFRGDGARSAAAFLAQAFAAWYVQLMTREADPASAAVHAKLRELLQESFPLSTEDYAAVDALTAEYEVMDSHDMTDRYPRTGYHMALLDPDFAEGRDVDDAPELVEAHVRYASRYHRLLAERHAIALCIGSDEFPSIEAALFHPAYSLEHGVLVYDTGDLAWWTNIAKDWHEIGERALGLQDPVEKPMQYTTASELAKRTLEFLESPPDGVMGEVTQEIAGTFANELGGDDPVNQDVALDALIVGYQIRAAEMTTGHHDHINETMLHRYLEAQAEESTPGITIAGAALQIAESLPMAFSGPDDAWRELRSWATDHAVQRAWRRYGLGLNGDYRRPTMTDDQVAAAVDQGYALRSAETELSIRT